MRDYSAARGLFDFMAFLGWAAVVVGAIVVFVGLSGAASMRGDFGGLLALTAIAPGLSLALIGLLLVALVQMGRAGIDTAHNTENLLFVAKEQLQLFKTNSTYSSGRSAAAPVSAAAAATTRAAPAASAAAAPAAGSVPTGYSSQVSSEHSPVDGALPHLTYLGVQIWKHGEHFLVDDHSFRDAVQAREHIDFMKGRKKPAATPLLTAERAEPSARFNRQDQLR